MKIKQILVIITILFLSGSMLILPVKIEDGVGMKKNEIKQNIKSSDITAIFRPIGDIQTQWDNSEGFSNIDEEVYDPDPPDGLDNSHSSVQEAKDIYSFGLSNVKIYSITIYLYASCFAIGGEARLTFKFGHGMSGEWSTAEQVIDPLSPSWISFTWEGLYYIINSLQITLTAKITVDGVVSVDALYAEITYSDLISEKYRPIENFQSEWDNSDFSNINDDVIAPDLPDGLVNIESGYDEHKTDIYNVGVMGVNIYSLTVHMYASCIIAHGGLAKISVKYRFGEDEEWSNSNIIEDPFGPAWISFSWQGLDNVANNLQIAIKADIYATGLEGVVSVDALYVEMVYIDEYYESLSNVDDIDAEMVWGGMDGATNVVDPIKAGEGIKVCIIDTGIDYNHPAFLGRYMGGCDTQDDDYDPYDDNGHGTKASGIIAASDDGKGNIGVAPRVSLYAVDVYDHDHISYPYGPVWSGILWAVINEMDVIYVNTQIETPTGMLEGACLMAYMNGIVVVAPTGNTDAVSEIAYPAAYPWVICVGAVSHDSSGYVWSGYTPTGSELDVVAIDNGFTTLLGGGYGSSLSGTSFTGPYVAGVCALIRANHPTYTPDQVKQALINTCKDQINTKPPGDIAYDPLGWDSKYGYGLVNAYGASETINPTVSIVAPSSIIYEGTVTCKASAADNYGVHSVKFKVDSGSWNSATYNPSTGNWQWAWSTGSGNIYHTLYCRAYDGAGNYKETSKTIYVKTPSGGGGGCPILSVFDGETYTQEGLLDIHNIEGKDVIYKHTLITQPLAVNRRFLFRLVEHPVTISHIDKVELWGELINGKLIKIPLISAVHCKEGQIRRLLWRSDDKKIDLLGGDHTDGLSQSIDLLFFVPRRMRFTKFIFIIEGNNYFVK